MSVGTTQLVFRAPNGARFRLLGISGSLRANSYSTAVLKALAVSVAEHAEFDYADIGALPHFNQDLYSDPLPAGVQQMRDQVLAADAIVISSPEYNHGIPGVLKNAIDWTSRPHNGSPWRNKPVLIVTSSHAVTGGVRAQYQIRESLLSALARPVNTPEIVVGLVNTKIVEGTFDHPVTIDFARNGLAATFDEILRGRASVA